jgi:hypothetical protein
MSVPSLRRSNTLFILSTLFVAAWLVIAAMPFLWTLWGSFKVQGDFFSKADWRYAIEGVRTAVETGGAFTGQGYHGAWVEQEFWRAALNTLIVVFFRRHYFAYLRNPWRLCACPFRAALCILDPDGGTAISGDATYYAGLWLLAAIF